FPYMSTAKARSKTGVFAFRLKADVVGYQIVDFSVLDSAAPSRHVKWGRRAVRVELRDVALAFEDARLQFVLGVAFGHVDQVGHQLRGFGVGVRYAAFPVRAMTAGATVIVINFVATLHWVHYRWKTQCDGLLAQMHQEVGQCAGLTLSETKLWHNRAGADGLRLSKMLYHPLGRAPQPDVIERRASRAALAGDGVATDAAFLLKQSL